MTLTGMIDMCPLMGDNLILMSNKQRKQLDISTTLTVTRQNG